MGLVALCPSRIEGTTERGRGGTMKAGETLYTIYEDVVVELVVLSDGQTVRMVGDDAPFKGTWKILNASRVCRTREEALARLGA